MFLTKQVKKDLLKKLLQVLGEPKTETVYQKERISGRTLIYQGQTKTKTGKQILPGQTYERSTLVEVNVNHKRRIMRLMDQAKNQEELTDLLGSYLAKYADKKEDLKKAIE